jgi:hypothetical protein
MKVNGRIFVEGESDKKFLSDFVSYRFGSELQEGVIEPMGGKEGLNIKKERLLRNSDLGLKNLVIIDANGSFDKSKDFIERQRTNLRVDFEYFLIPNNKDIGDLETLLENIATPGNRFVLECFEDYLTCLKKSNQALNYPGRKTKIYAYLDLLNQETKPHLVNYRNQSLWNLDSEHLDPLYNFLRPYFTQE